MYYTNQLKMLDKIHLKNELKRLAKIAEALITGYKILEKFNREISLLKAKELKIRELKSGKPR